MLAFLCLSSILLAGELTDQQKLEADIHKIIESYKENPKGFVEIKDTDDSIKAPRYFDIVIVPNERTTKVFSEKEDVALLFPGNLEDYGVEIRHETNKTKDEFFIPSQSLVMIGGNETKHKFTVRVCRMPPLKNK